jgi:hypothetical protein
MKYAVEMGSVTIIYIPFSLRFSGIQKLIWKIHRQTDRMDIP